MSTNEQHLKLKPKQQILDLIEQQGKTEKFTKNLADEDCRNHPFFDGEYQSGHYHDKVTGETHDQLWMNAEFKRSNYAGPRYQYLRDNVEYIPSDSDKEFARIKNILYENDGDGNEKRIVLHIPDYDLYIKLLGTHSSWDSSTWEETLVVRPKQVMITLYE